MIRILTLVLLLANSLTIYCQTRFTFDGLDTLRVRKIETDLSSKEFKPTYKISISPDYFPGATNYKLEQPLVFIRPDSTFINDLEVEYFYTKTNDQVRLIVYNWDSKTNSREVLNDLSPEDLRQHKIKVYNKKYEEVYNYLISLLGNPTKGTGELVKVKEEGYGESKRRNATWNTATGNAELNMVWSDQNIKTSQGYTLIPTFRIRAKIYWD